jgi:two-component system NarL family sensor kinase
VQEALGNVHRHSGSLTARVCLRRHEQDVMVEIRDMGRGIPPQKLSSFNEGVAVLGVGLAGMRERLHQLGGRLEVESSASGTRVRAMVTVEPGPIAKAE